MPRDGANVYHLPPGTAGVTDTSIDSAKYNAFIADIEQDMNTPRPIVAGGTGASSAAGAMANLGGELAKQVITNYDSAVFVAGSFYSSNVTGQHAPVDGHAFSGICYVSDANNMVIEARDLDDTTQPGAKWVRQLKASVWSAWLRDPSTASIAGTFVAKAGDTMTGLLVLSADPSAALNAATKQYVDNRAVRYDAAQALTDVQGAQARQNIAAAPFDALAFNGMQVNGAMEICQQFVGLANTGINGGIVHMADSFKIGASGPVILTGQMVSDAPPGYTSSMKISVTTADATLAAGSYVSIFHFLEGYRVARLRFGTASAQPASIAFWVKAHRPGQYGATVVNAAANRSYPFTYTINVADTWEFKTITIPGDVTGTWAGGAALGLTLSFALAAGASLAGAPGAWVAANNVGATGCVNGIAATSDTFQLTGLILLPGIELPSVTRAPFLVRPLDYELALCQRYYEKSYEHGTTPGTNETNGAEMWFVRDVQATVGAMASMVPFKVPKRVDPTVILYSISGTAGKATDIWNGSTLVNVSSGFVGQKRFWWSASPSAGFSVQQLAVHWAADARI